MPTLEPILIRCRLPHAGFPRGWYAVQESSR
jgi:hypothetical protein